MRFDGRPIVGICNTWSELTPCNAHLRELADYVKRGVWEAGGVPIEFPAISLGETQMRPTAMFLEPIEYECRGIHSCQSCRWRCSFGGCDKTTRIS